MRRGLSLLLLALILSSAGWLARSRGWIPERNVFQPIIEALERIGTGDFSVQLDDRYREDPIAGELVSTVNKMALDLDQMESLRQEFVSNVSHEIQSPLTSIRGFARALEDDRLGAEDRRHYLGIIEEESTRLSRLTDNLLCLASLESSQTRVGPKPYSLDRQIRSQILASEPQWREKEIEFGADLEEIEIDADQDLLGEVWANFIHNSIKFTPQGGRIRIALRRRGRLVEFQIADTGIGISEQDQSRVFERFFKADKSRTPSNGGSGLGLSIAQKIVQMHRGRIEVRSQLGEGTTFTVVLPLTPSDMAAQK